MAENYPYPEMLEQVLKELEGDPALISIMLKYPLIAKWVQMRKERAARELAKELEKKRIKEEKKSLEKLKEELLNKLSDREQEALGIGKYEKKDIICAAELETISDERSYAVMRKRIQQYTGDLNDCNEF